MVQPDTVIRWHRQAFRLYCRWKSRRGSSGRPKIDVELRALIRRVADENPTWRAPRVCKEIVRLGFEISPRTVARYMPRRPPCSAAQWSWRTFIANHRDAIAAIDLFVALQCTLLGDAPLGRPIEQRPAPASTIAASPRLGGLHHRDG